jgi:hypothetical protein
VLHALPISSSLSWSYTSHACQNNISTHRIDTIHYNETRLLQLFMTYLYNLHSCNVLMFGLVLWHAEIVLITMMSHLHFYSILGCLVLQYTVTIHHWNLNVSVPPPMVRICAMNQAIIPITLL